MPMPAPYTPIVGPATLLEWTKGADYLTQSIASIFAQNSPIIRVLPFDNVQGGGYRYEIRTALPGIAFRGINETYSPSIGVVNPQFEPLFICGGHLDVDNAILQMHGPGRRAKEVEAQAISAALEWTNVFLKGDSSVDPRQFDGLQVRLVGNQVLSNSATAGGGALSLMNLDLAISRVRLPTHILMPTKLKLRLTAAARDKDVGGMLQTQIDNFGNQITTYNGIPVLDAGFDVAGHFLLDFVEAATGGGANTATSIYVLSLRPGAIWGIQAKPFEAIDLGDLKTEPKQRIRAEWLNGFVVEDPLAGCRLRDIADLAVVK